MYMEYKNLHYYHHLQYLIQYNHCFHKHGNIALINPKRLNYFLLMKALSFPTEFYFIKNFQFFKFFLLQILYYFINFY